VVLEESPLAEKSLVARESGDCGGSSNLNCSPEEQAHNIFSDHSVLSAQLLRNVFPLAQTELAKQMKQRTGDGCRACFTLQ